MKDTYAEKAINLARAIDIAIEKIQKYPPRNFQAAQVEHFVNTYSDIKDKALNPAPQFANTSSLEYHVQDVFIYFQECTGEAVERFWEGIRESNLPFARENKLLQILKKGKIKNQNEYDYVVDTVIPFQQADLIDSSQVMKLNVLINAFEKRAGKKNKL